MKVWSTKTITTFFSVLLSCAIVLSFGLHTIELKHTHPGEHVHHEGEPMLVVLGDYMHGTEKKSFLFLLASLLLASLYVVSSVGFSCVSIRVEQLRGIFVRTICIRVHCYLCLLFKKGILNTKYY